jgi:hypothetical protein
MCGPAAAAGTGSATSMTARQMASELTIIGHLDRIRQPTKSMDGWMDGWMVGHTSLSLSLSPSSGSPSACLPQEPRLRNRGSGIVWRAWVGRWTSANNEVCINGGWTSETWKCRLDLTAEMTNYWTTCAGSACAVPRSEVSAERVSDNCVHKKKRCLACVFNSVAIM